MRAILDAEGIEEVGGVLFDFGVSSHQLDVAERGFSFRQEGPLDMRMGPDTGADAGTLVNEASVEDLARIIARYGEERFAGRIARAIVSGRPIHTTSDLAATVRNAIPAATRRTGGHPARRTFQALRMAVNDELGAIEAGLDQALEALAPGGRCVAISYHSLEDRLVKRRFRAGSTGPDLPGLPVEPQTELRLLTRAPVTPSDDEVIRNPRARSARLRAVEKAV